MKLKNAVIGTKVQVKRPHAMRGVVGIIVAVDGDESPLVQFDTEFRGLTDTRRGFKHSRFIHVGFLKRIKE